MHTLDYRMDGRLMHNEEQINLDLGRPPKAFGISAGHVLSALSAQQRRICSSITDLQATNGRCRQAVRDVYRTCMHAKMGRGVTV